MTQVTNMTPNALRDQAAKAHLDANTAGYLRSAAAALETTQRDLKRARRAADLRTTPEAKRTISALQADRRHLQDALDRLLVGRTAFVIAHRLSTIKNADRILVLEDGRLVEDGTHDQLMEQNGLYAHLYQIQYLSKKENN